jgi:hypothetical protein
MRPPRVVLAAACAALLAAGCADATKTPFARAAQDAAGGFAAAAQTIEDLHAGRLTREYAAATLGVLDSGLRGAPDALRMADGAPSPDVAVQLAEEASTAARVVAAPCLDPGCDWEGQVDGLRATANALVGDAAR